MLLTRLPLSTCPRRDKPAHDLHVLGVPPAFALSQDQTLQKNLGTSYRLFNWISLDPSSSRIPSPYSVAKEPCGPLRPASLPLLRSNNIVYFVDGVNRKGRLLEKYPLR